MFHGNTARKFCADERGNIAIMFAVAALPLCALISGAIDYTRATGERARLQMAIDAAVLAGAKMPPNQQVGTAQHMFSLNLDGASGGNADNAGAPSGAGQPGAVGGLTVAFTPEDDGLRGIASKQVETTLLSLLQIPALDVRVEAKARAEETDAGDRVCVTLTGEQQQQSYMLLMAGATRINAPNCEIHLIKQQAIPLMSGSSRVDARRVCVKGTSQMISGAASAPIELNCADAATDVYAGTIPVPSNVACQHNNFVVNGSGTNFINPGVYCGHTVFNGTGKVQMTPGLYVFQGNVTLNGSKTLEGDGVTLYLSGASQLTVNGSGGMKLTAPASGTYKGVLMFSPPNNTGYATAAMIFNGSTKQQLEGLVYMPSHQLTINGGGTAEGSKFTLVLWALWMNGSVQLSIEPDATAVAVGGANAPGMARLVH